MSSDTVFQSDQRQSISVEDATRANAPKPSPIGVGTVAPDGPEVVPGVVCAKDASHGRMLMSAKTQMLECGACGWSQA